MQQALKENHTWRELSPSACRNDDFLPHAIIQRATPAPSYSPLHISQEMAELPASLKLPDISRFVNRANQLRIIKPAIAYWCEYHAVNQIVSKSLHNADDEAFAFTRGLIERLESTKAARADDDAIVDNDAGRAYVEQFAEETFARAERTLRANKVTRQTADTFDAAATFFELGREWGSLEDETAQRIRFAKWNAARILRAIREGTDPNETNPKPTTSLDDTTGEQELRPGAGEGSGFRPLPASVEDVPETTGFPLESDGASLDSSKLDQDAILKPKATGPMDFGVIAQDSATPSAPDLPNQAPPASGTQIPLQPSPHIPTKLPPEFQLSEEAPSDIALPPVAPVAQTPPPQQVIRPPPPPVAPAAPPAPEAVNLRDIGQAQKHAKWAISALNFEDVPTAVNELRNALAALGTR
ncbi:hypothetical protein CDD81_7807 [Ophiocordyceps australis]|uniref:Vta1 C-terminal domain-containing protein n=1 Tax=Ophiocordyceps australis TaxID=1399860 RepID=A0A2C5YGV0_9HYPO|nr:hypothetical protein CDD81_7807 [Ophiocordyceps australis]